MKSKIYSSDYMKTTSKGQLWIPVLLTLGYMLAFPVMLLLMLGNWFAYETVTMDQIRKLYEELWRDGLMSTGFVVTSIAALLNGINNLWYLYSSRKTDLYHSLPVKRSKMFWHRTFMGILYYLIPYAVMEFLAICIGAMRGCFSLKIMGLSLEMLVMHLILYLFFYFTVVLVICVTGNILMGGLCLAGVFLYSATLGNLIGYYKMMFYGTFYSNAACGFEKFLKEYGSPVLFGKAFIGKYAENDFGDMLLVVLAVTAVLGLLSCTAYIRRPSECSGKPMIYDWIGVILKFLVVIPCGLGVGLIFYSLPEQNSRFIWWIFGLILGTLIAHGCVEVVYQMDFHRFLAKKHHLVLAGILVALCAVSYKTDLTHYDSYLPERDKIASLHIDFSMFDNTSYLIYENEDGSYETNTSWTDEAASVIDDQGVNEDTYEAMQKIVTSNSEKVQEGLSSSADRMMDEDGWRYSIPVKYTLRSGKEIYRKYSVSPDEFARLLKGLYEGERFKENKFSFLKIEDKYLENIDGSFYDNMNYRLFQENPKKKEQLLQAVREDLAAAGPEEMTGQPCAELCFQFNLPHKPEYYETTEADGFAYYFYFGNIKIMPTFQKTIAILKETGYPLSVEELDIKGVDVSYWKSTGKYESDEVSVEYTDETELAEIKQALVPSLLWCYWLDYVSDLDVSFSTDEQLQYDNGGYLIRDKTPEFILEERLRNDGKNSEA